MRTLNHEEIDTVDGGFGLWGAALGAVAGAGGYAIGTLASGGTPNLGGALIAGSLGATSGFLGNAAGAFAAAGYRGAAGLAQFGSVTAGFGAAGGSALTHNTGTRRRENPYEESYSYKK